MTEFPEQHRHYRLIEQALEFLSRRHQQQPSLAEVAAHVGLSEFYLQRLFSDWAGISPKRFLQFLNKEYIKSRLEQNQSVLDASLDAGLSSTSRLHDLFVETESMTPAQYRSMGRELDIYYNFFDSPFGEYLLGVTDRGICHLAFLDRDRESALADFREEWQAARLVCNEAHTGPVHERLFGPGFRQDRPLHVLLKGTNFQIKVWEALLRLPMGNVCDYSAIARGIGAPSATRAAASAIARNRIAFLIPCHRVVRKIGETGEYRWGRQRKKIILAWEAACVNPLMRK